MMSSLVVEQVDLHGFDVRCRTDRGDVSGRLAASLPLLRGADRAAVGVGDEVVVVTLKLLASERICGSSTNRVFFRITLITKNGLTLLCRVAD